MRFFGCSRLCPFLCGFSVFAEFSYGFYQNFVSGFSVPGAGLTPPPLSVDARLSLICLDGLWEVGDICKSYEDPTLKTRACKKGCNSVSFRTFFLLDFNAFKCIWNVSVKIDHPIASSINCVSVHALKMAKNQPKWYVWLGMKFLR